MGNSKFPSGGEQDGTRRRAKLQAIGVPKTVLTAYDSAPDDAARAEQIIVWCRMLRKARRER